MDTLNRMPWAAKNAVFQRLEEIAEVSENTTANVSIDYVQFVGTYSPVDIYTDEKTNLYLGADNTLYYPWANDMTSFKVNSCRAYFHLNGITAGDKNGSVRAFNLNFGDGEQTGIASPKSSPEGKDFSPLLQEGTGEAWYTLDGRRLAGRPARRGVYVHSASGRLQDRNNGRKVVIK